MRYSYALDVFNFHICFKCSTNRPSSRLHKSWDLSKCRNDSVPLVSGSTIVRSQSSQTHKASWAKMMLVFKGLKIQENWSAKHWLLVVTPCPMHILLKSHSLCSHLLLHLLYCPVAFVQHPIDCSCHCQRAAYACADSYKKACESLRPCFSVDDFHWWDVLRGC